MKPCSVCAVVSDNYSPDKRAKDGLQSRCRDCCRKAHAERYASDKAAAQSKRRDYYAKNREKVLTTNAKSRAAHADSVLAGKRKYYERVKSDPRYVARVAEYQEKTKDRKRAYDRAYRSRNPELQIQRAKEWKAHHPEKRRAILRQYGARRRAKESAGIDGGTLAAWTATQPKQCFYCGVECETTFHVDHFYPLAKGGAHVLTNLRIACAPCNLRKNARDPLEWMEQAA